MRWFLRIIQMMTGMPTRDAIALMGTAASLAMMSHDIISAPPQRSVAGMRTLWSAFPAARRATCGTASPRNPTGPQNAVTVPARSTTARNIRLRIRPISAPMDAA